MLSKTASKWSPRFISIAVRCLLWIYITCSIETHFLLSNFIRWLALSTGRPTDSKWNLQQSCLCYIFLVGHALGILWKETSRLYSNYQLYRNLGESRPSYNRKKKFSMFRIEFNNDRKLRFFFHKNHKSVSS